MSKRRARPDGEAAEEVFPCSDDEDLFLEEEEEEESSQDDEPQPKRSNIDWTALRLMLAVQQYGWGYFGLCNDDCKEKGVSCRFCDKE